MVVEMELESKEVVGIGLVVACYKNFAKKY